MSWALFKFTVEIWLGFAAAFIAVSAITAAISSVIHRILGTVMPLDRHIQAAQNAGLIRDLTGKHADELRPYEDELADISQWYVFPGDVR